MANTQPPEAEKYVSSPEDAATNAAYRLNVALVLLRAQVDPSEKDSVGDDGGFGMWTLIDLVESIRDDLRESVAEAEKQRQTKEAAQ